MNKIVSIKISRDPSKVFLTLSSGLFIPIFIDDLVKLKLKSHQEINQTELDQIVQTSLAFLFKEYTLRQISISPKTPFLISLKLRKYLDKIYFKYKFPPIHNADEIINNCISWLNTKNLLKETDFIESFINKNKYKSKTEIEFLLSQQGINNSLIKEFSFKIDDKERIKKLLKKKASKDKNKLIAFLIRKGFKFSDIKNSIDDLINKR